MTKLTASEYRNRMAKKIEPAKKSKPVKEKLSTKEALRAMGEYFELDSKKTAFFIRQMELSEKI
jgi:hypothetical protein